MARGASFLKPLGESTMYQAITTKYLGPTNVRGSRVKASCQAGSITLHWDDALNSDQNHIAAAKALAVKYEWDGRWHGGAPNGSSGIVFVLVTDDDRDGFTVSAEDK